MADIEVSLPGVSCPRNIQWNGGAKMKRIGRLMFVLGVGSIVLGFMNMQFILLSWVDSWGPAIGWAIKIVFIVAGGALWFLGNKNT